MKKNINSYKNLEWVSATNNMSYQDGQEVIIHSLGDDKEYIGIIRGIISSCNNIVSYMVEIDIEDEYQYSVRTIPEHCIKPITDKLNNMLLGD